MAKIEIAEVRRRFAAAPERVFAAFADPVLVAQWLRPAPEIALTVLTFDFRVGGAYRFSYGAPGSDPVVLGGVFRRIAPPEAIAFSWVIEPPDEHAGLESEVFVAIAQDGAGSELVIRHEWPDGRADAISRHAGGWRGAVDLLASLVEGRAGG